VFVQQSLQPKLSCRCYASVSYGLQNSTVFKSTQNWVSVMGHRQREWIWTGNSKTSLTISRCS